MISDDVEPPLQVARPQAWARLPAFDRSGGELYTPRIVGVTPVGATTLIVGMDEGTVISFGWKTGIITSWSGREQRESPYGTPRRRVSGPAFLRSGADREIKAKFVRYAALGAKFDLALPFEEASVTSVAGLEIGVADTSVIDWAIAGVRVVLIGLDGVTTALGIVQAVGPTSMTVAKANEFGNLVIGELGAAAAVGARIMPLLSVVLDTNQGFTRYPINVDMWNIAATAVAFGWGGVDSMGRGALVTTYANGPTPMAQVSDADLLIWDRVNATPGTVQESMIALTQLVDYGALVFTGGAAAVPEWTRTVEFASSSPADWQWFKAFIRLVRGRQVAWLLPTGHRDLIPIAPVPGGLLVQSASVSGAGDAVAWFNSLAHRRLQVIGAEVPQYVQILGVHDNGDGTTTLSLDNGVFGPITKVSFLELVRFEREDTTGDVIEATWDGGTFSVSEQVRVIGDQQQEITVGSAWAGSGRDGNVTMDGINAVPGCSRSGTVYTALRDLYYDTLTGLAGVTLDTGSFLIHARTALVGPATGTFTISRNGRDAVTLTPGAGYTSADGSIGNTSGGSGTGASGSSGAGATGNSGSGIWPTSSHPGVGGAGGNGTNPGGAGGGGAATFASETSGSVGNIMAAARWRFMTANNTGLFGGGGGSSGGGSGTAAGGAGGGGADNIFVAAGQFVNPANILIQAKGGKGGNGVGLNCGGGGGGGGGMIAVVAGRGSFPVCDNSGGAGGASGGGTGQPGSAGGSGPSPELYSG